MIAYVIVTITALVCAICASMVISKALDKNDSVATPLAWHQWVLSIVLFVGINLGFLALGWSWPPVGLLIGIMAATILYPMDRGEEYLLSVFASVPLAVTTIFCLMTEADKLGKTPSPILIATPILELIAIYLIGKIKTLPEEKRKKLVTPWNILTCVCIIAVIVAVVAFIKEVALK